MQTVYTLAIESSCDDTSIAVLRNDTVLSNVVSSQLVHQNHGGVVPELASRAHLKNILPVFEAALKKANIFKKDLSVIAYTNGPGLMGALLVGVSFAKSLSMALKIPMVTVNHIKAHVLAHLIKSADYKIPSFPFLCLTVSGGHTQIVKVDSPYEMKIVGETIDDAAGEAFDKVAKMLNLPYPGGPLIDKLSKKGNPNAFKFSDPTYKTFDFTFSGLKTSILYTLQKEVKHQPNFIEDNIEDICASVQKTIVEALGKQLKKSADYFNINRVAIAGGVSANSALRQWLKNQQDKGWEVFIPEFQYCTDNAGMIGIAGYYNYLNNEFAAIDTVPKSRLKI